MIVSTLKERPYDSIEAFDALRTINNNAMDKTVANTIEGVQTFSSNISVLGNTALGNAVGDTTTITGATSITTTSASGLAVGRLGATTPALVVDASTATCVTGVKVKSAIATGGVAVSTVSSGTNESLTIDAKGNGTVTINGTATGIVVLPAGTTIGGSTVSALGVVTSSSANALAVGQNGTTNPAFNIDASTATSATGLNIKSAAAAGGVAVSVTSSGVDESITLDAKGAGTVTIAGTSTGAINLNKETDVTGILTVTNDTSNAFIVGRTGVTNPAFNIDTSTATCVTGLKVKAAALAGGMAVSVTSSGADEALTIDAKGAGTIGIGTVSTGLITVGAATSHSSTTALVGVTTVTATAGIVSSEATTNQRIVPFYACGIQTTPAPTAAIPLTNHFNTLNSTAGATTQTLAASTVIGQVTKIQMIVDGGDDVVTVTSLLGGTTITFADVGDTAELMWNGTNWVAIALYNIVDGATAPVLA